MRGRALLLPLVLLVTSAACRTKHALPKSNPLRNAYCKEQDWNNPDHWIPLNYQESQGKRLFYTYCVWCHADSTPVGPSNRSMLTPTPHLINDGAALNSLSDQYLDNIIALGGSAMGKSAMMPPYGRSLSPEEVHAIIAYMRAIAQPPYVKPPRPAPRYEGR